MADIIVARKHTIQTCFLSQAPSSFPNHSLAAVSDCFDPYFLLSRQSPEGQEESAVISNSDVPAEFIGGYTGRHLLTGPPKILTGAEPGNLMFSTFNIGITPTDTILISSDGVTFAVHSHILLDASSNSFSDLIVRPAGPCLSSPAIIFASEPSDVLNIVLHSLYDVTYNKYNPTFESIVSSVCAFKKYGLIPLRKFLSPSKPLYDMLLFYAPLHAGETYTLAAEEKLEELAVSSSAYTLAMKLYELPEDWVVRMGTLYLHRLYRLHGTRMHALKNILETKLYPHVAQPHCSIVKRRETNSAYGLACAKIYYDASPAMTCANVNIVMNKLIRSVTCDDCRDSLQKRAQYICTEWLLLARTI